MTTRSEISEWFDRGKVSGEGYMIVVCDTFDYDDYPVYASEETFEEKYASYRNASMQSIMEVYDLKLDKEMQLNEFRSFHYPKGFLDE